EVDDARDAEREEEERDRDEERAGEEGLRLGHLEALHAREDLEPRALVLLLAEDADREEVRDLPEEEDGEEDQPRWGARPGRARPPHARRQGARHGTHEE